MLCIYLTTTEPQFNLAAEEYFLKHKQEDCFMLWRNGPSIIVGKHQNTQAEINTKYVKDNNINVVRRLTGGGAVFHDLGNLNFTFIKTGGEYKQLIDFRKYTRPILDVLQKLDINAHFHGRNDLVIDGKKFSGNAEHVFKNRILHHGTLLFSSEMADLSAALKVDPLKFKDKAVKSVRSRVTNISEHLSQKMDVLEFKDLIMAHIVEMYPDAQAYELTADDIEKINEIRKERYDKWEWNFGQSPKYNLRKLAKTSGGFVEFDMNVENGIIREAKIFGDFFNHDDPQILADALKGQPHDYEAVKEKLSAFNIDDFVKNTSLEELLDVIF